mgnify:CR=1 FL=1
MECKYEIKLEQNKKLFAFMQISKNGWKKYIELFCPRETAISVLIEQALINKRHKNSIIPFESTQIGMNDFQLFLGLGLLDYNKKTKNIILKFFNFFPGRDTSINYFQLKVPNYAQFIKDNDINLEKCKDIVVVTPLTVNDHYSLLLFYNDSCFVLDFSLLYLIDNNKEKINSDINNLYGQLIEYLKSKNYNCKDILELVGNSDDIESIHKGLIERKIKDIKITDLAKNIINLSNNYNMTFLDKKTAKLNKKYFISNDICQNVKVLNLFSIQGKNSCSYFCLAAYKQIIDNNYSIKDIIYLCSNGIFQIKTLIIILNDFLNDKQQIFIIGEFSDNINYYKYQKDNIIIGIKKKIDNLDIPIRNKLNYEQLDLSEFIDIDAIQLMLSQLGYKII